MYLNEKDILNDQEFNNNNKQQLIDASFKLVKANRKQLLLL